MSPQERRRTPSADLHVHTTHSDGSCSPGDVVRAAATVGLTALAITDHDTVSAIPLARTEADRLGIELIAGIELTAERDGKEVHLLGHFVRDDDDQLIAVTRTLQAARVDRIEQMVDRLTKLGLSINLDSIRRTFPRSTIGRKHLADWLSMTQQVSNAREAFSRFLGDDGPAMVAKPRVPWTDAIALIRQAGGVAGLAHPPFHLQQSHLADYHRAGLGAIEVNGPGIGAKLGQRWRSWAQSMGLIPISGSDFHTPDRPGRWVGSIVTETAELQRLRDAARQTL